MPQHSYFKTLLSTLPHSFETSFFNQLNHLINYSLTIGLMGKTGAGKSRLIINALFQSSLSPVSAVWLHTSGSAFHHGNGQPCNDVY